MKMVLRTLVRLSTAKRIPLIKFRKGGNQSTASSIGVANNQASSPAATKSKGAAAASAAIEDWELPQRFCRKPIEPEEIEYINNGGPP